MLYLAGPSIYGPIKLGYSRDVLKRLGTIQGNSPVRINLYAVGTFNEEIRNEYREEPLHAVPYLGRAILSPEEYRDDPYCSKLSRLYSKVEKALHDEIAHNSIFGCWRDYWLHGEWYDVWLMDAFILFSDISFPNLGIGKTDIEWRLV